MHGGREVEVSSLTLSVVPQQTVPHTSALPSLFHGPWDVEEVVARVVGLEAGGQQVTLLSHLAAITDATSYLCTNFVALFVFRPRSLLTFSLVALTFLLFFNCLKMAAWLVLTFWTGLPASLTLD